jgi:hypothetical protein
MTTPNVIISYSHDSEEHKAWVADLARFLVSNGDFELKRVIDPLESFHLQLKEEVEAHERLKRGEFEELDSLRGVARAS